MAPDTCRADVACQSCGARAGLNILEADTPVGIICLTLCDECADEDRAPRLSCPEAARLALIHAGHRPAGAGAAS
jgi:hypothetical protein